MAILKLKSEDVINEFDCIIIALIIILYIYVVIGINPKDKGKPISVYEFNITQCESYIERQVYKGLIQYGLHPTPQYSVGKYRIDLALPSKMIAIECDGEAYHSSPEQKAHDRKRDRCLKRKGWTVLRFSGSKINRDLSGII
ncbi:Protein of unknown function [Gracilibacillus ureilyticus]|uniref:Restriction endonuclease type II-like domain-containing protein n=1 Tax=Gracilibacillus ureilyticus TaxID=531814 RepID=A0A1H9LD61_9BACI|nr:DUF559 domain-containing protein [Gracilibacillus ureilyticus]SER09278.1 Protein of unknown function [Gracilibacillus ureilyticus]